MHRYKWNYFVANLKQRLSFTSFEAKQEKINSRTYDEEGRCLFCKLIEGEVIYKDSEIAVFEDIKHDAQVHLLVVPIEHITNILALNPSHIDLIQKMENIARSILSSLSDSVQVIGFHHPPINSIDHLHMHAIVKPIFNLKSRLSYSKYLWFITPYQVISRLRSFPNPNP